jgi:O-antigen ligase
VIYLLTGLRVGLAWRLGAVGCLVAALAFIAATGPGFASQASLLRTSGETRFDTLGPGLRAVVHHPVGGLGLGRSARAASHPPAHSALLQAGVEMGVLAIGGVGLLTAWCIVAAWCAIRSPGLEAMARGALVAMGLYALYTLVAGGVNAGLNNGLVSVWALTIALLMVIGVEAEDPGLTPRDPGNSATPGSDASCHAPR